jgi:hypothetical protein
VTDPSYPSVIGRFWREAADRMMSGFGIDAVLPLRLMTQALSQDHFAARTSMLWAAS